MVKEEAVSISRETASTNRNGFGFFLVFLMLAAFEALEGYSVLNINEHTSTIFYIGMHALFLFMVAILWIAYNESTQSQNYNNEDDEDDDFDSRDIVSESISNDDAYSLGIGH